MIKGIKLRRGGRYNLYELGKHAGHFWSLLFMRSYCIISPFLLIAKTTSCELSILLLLMSEATRTLKNYISVIWVPLFLMSLKVIDTQKANQGICFSFFFPPPSSLYPPPPTPIKAGKIREVKAMMRWERLFFCYQGLYELQEMRI